MDSRLTIMPPLSRRGHGPGLLLLVDEKLDLGRNKKTLDPPPLIKWAEEGFAVVQLRATTSEGDLIRGGLCSALSELSRLSSCDQTKRIGIIIYLPVVEPTVLEMIGAFPAICAVVWYGAPTANNVHSELPLLVHVVGATKAEGNTAGDGGNVKSHYYAHTRSFFAIPAHEDYKDSSSSVSHTRTLSFLKPLVGGPCFDLEKIWDEHTYWEFEARSVEETMATMVEEPYVNHIPTLTGGVGRQALTNFYRDHFIFSNPPDTELELVSRTVGIDRVVDEFLFKATHDRMIDWLAPGIPATGQPISIPFTSVVNIRGDRLYHEHISWDQATLLKQLGLLPDYLPFPYPIKEEAAANNTNLEYRLPVAGAESALKLFNQSSMDSNAMLQYRYREASRPKIIPHSANRKAETGHSGHAAALQG
ncbi:hypothetical protein F5B19DRAFT_496892 [Rostrohypoxylon terebratum]|nr:hypothetical protein F5B19DRAFT_496892 [Rostrohypoxylon terebratum]